MARARRSAARWAIYYTPPPESALAAFGRAWFEGGAPPALLEAPRRYGFHATLKAPFRLADGICEGELQRAVRRLALRHCRVEGPPLRVGRLGSFVALLPAAPCPALDALAAACVRAFDRYRAPLAPAERRRRNPAALSPRQRAHLVRWGYPFVFADTRFHITLSGPLPRERLRHVAVAARALFDDLAPGPFAVDAITLACQPDPGASFETVAGFPLARR